MASAFLVSLLTVLFFLVVTGLVVAAAYALGVAVGAVLGVPG